MSAGFFLFYESLYASYTGHRIAVNQVHAAPPPQKKQLRQTIQTRFACASIVLLYVNAHFSPSPPS